MIPGFGRSPKGGQSYPLQYSCLENLQGQRSLVGLKELDMTELLSTTHIALYKLYKMMVVMGINYS